MLNQITINAENAEDHRLLMLAKANRVGEPEVGYDPTRPQHVKHIVRLARLKPYHVVLDIGCGDGRFLIEATQTYGVKAIGIECNPVRFKIAEQNVRLMGLEDQITLIYKKYQDVMLPSVNVVFSFLGRQMIDDVAKFVAQSNKRFKLFSYYYPLSREFCYSTPMICQHPHNVFYAYTFRHGKFESKVLKKYHQEIV
jgi:predicted RNA methylase